MIHELLATGKENARSGRELATLCKCDIRSVTAQIERERRQGKPICATMRGKNAGYYLASTPDELKGYCDQLRHRAGELFKTRRALLDVLTQYQTEGAANG